MSNPYFHFKQFSIRHDRCAMKVGTDGVLLGAWCTLPAEGRVLDIGTGTGLVALMVAQRSPAVHVTGVEIDHEAVLQARENVTASPFAERIAIVESSLQDYLKLQAHPATFDALVCNPPFFEERLLPPDAARSAARHTDTLPFSTLVEASSRLLADGGSLSVVLPATRFEDFRRLCFDQGLVLKRVCHVRTTPAKAPKRTLAAFCKTSTQTTALITEELTLQDGLQRSAEYAQLTHDFYL